MVRRSVLLFLTALGLLLASACGATSDQSGTPQSEPTATSPDAAAPTDTPRPVTTPTPNGGNVRLEVIDFQVWQDFMPGIREGGPPLHATVLLRADGLSEVRPGVTVGTITISRPGGETVTQAPVTLVEAVTVPGAEGQGKMDLQLAMAPSQVSIELTENEPLVGKLELTLDGSSITLDLPETPLMFTH